MQQSNLTWYGKNYLFVTKNTTTLLDSLNKIKLHALWNPCRSNNGKFLIVCTTFCYLETFEILWKQDITRVSIVNLQRGEIIVADAFAEPNQCATVVKYTITYTLANLKASGNREKLKFFNVPKKLSHCYLRTLIFDTIFSFPFLQKSKQKNTTEGLFMDPLLLVTSMLNITLVYLHNNLQFQERYFNLNDMNIFVRLIQNRTIDTFAAAQGTNDLYNLCGNTMAFFYDDHVWVVPKAQKVQNVEIIVKIFTPEALVAIIFAQFLSALFIYCAYRINYFSYNISYSTCIVYVCKIMLEMRVRVVSIHGLKMFVACFFLYALEVSCFFKSALSSLMINPGNDKEINSLQELLSSNLVVWLYNNARHLLRLLNTELSEKLYKRSTNRSIVVSELQAIQDIILFRNFSTHVKAAYLLSNLKYKRAVHVLGSDYLDRIEASFPFRDGHPLRERIDDAIIQLFDFGFNVKFMRSVVVYEFEESPESHVSLTADHLWFCFVVLIAGLTFAIIVFGVENAVFLMHQSRYKLRSRILRIVISRLYKIF